MFLSALALHLKARGLALRKPQPCKSEWNESLKGVASVGFEDLLRTLGPFFTSHLSCNSGGFKGPLNVLGSPNQHSDGLPCGVCAVEFGCQASLSLWWTGL